MWARLKDVWFPRFLFLLTMGLAASLAVLVLAGPWLLEEFNDLPYVVEIFSTDLVVRRTALGSAAGLAVTACVFFRPGILPFLRAKRERKHVPPPIAGA